MDELQQSMDVNAPSSPQSLRLTEAETQHDAQADVAERLIELLLEGNYSPRQIAELLDLTMSELAALCARQDVVDRLRHLSQLADQRAQLLLSHYRATIIARLISIATEGDPGEPARKACVDLIKANLNVFHTNNDASTTSEGEAVAGLENCSLSSIQQALEALGRTTDEDGTCHDHI